MSDVQQMKLSAVDGEVEHVDSKCKITEEKIKTDSVDVPYNQSAEIGVKESEEKEIATVLKAEESTSPVATKSELPVEVNFRISF